MSKNHKLSLTGLVLLCCSVSQAVPAAAHIAFDRVPDQARPRPVAVEAQCAADVLYVKGATSDLAHQPLRPLSIQRYPLRDRDPRPAPIVAQQAQRGVPARMAPSAAREREVREAYAKLPLTFAVNAGQVDERVRYYGERAGFSVYFTAEEMVLALIKGGPPSGLRARPAERALGGLPEEAASPASGTALGLAFVGANPAVRLEGNRRAPGAVNYFLGNDPAQWRTGLPLYEEVVYRELWPGVDMVVRGQAGELKYEFLVQPGARVQDIRLAYRGADGLSLDRTGNLRIETGLGVLRDARPVSYQTIAGRRVPVASRFVLTSGAEKNGYGFAVGDGYDPDYPLVIDPGLVYSTFLGGTNDDIGSGIALDAAGNAYLTGRTFSSDFPPTHGAFDTTFNGIEDAFVTKLNAAGSALVYSTFLGGSSGDAGSDIALDAAGNAYLTGRTTSSDFPTTPGAFDTTFGGIFPGDAFVTKLDAAGSALVYSTFLGGGRGDEGSDIALDAAGNAYLTGSTGSFDFPTTPGAFDTTFRGVDAFVTKLNAAGSALVYSTFLGGTVRENGSDIALDAAGNAYLTGETFSSDFPTTPEAFDRTCGTDGQCNAVIGEPIQADVFVSKLNAAGSALVYSTFLGGTDGDSAMDIALDAAGNAFLTGGTSSFDFPTTPGAYDRTLASFSDAFVAKLNASGSALAYSTLLGGGRGESGNSIALDAAGNAYLTGDTTSSDFPTTPGAFDRLCGTDGQCNLDPFSGTTTSDVFVTKLNAAGSALVYSTYLGGGGSESGTSIALDAAGSAYLTGVTASSDFPTTSGAFDTSFNGGFIDAFVTKLTLAAAGAVCAGLTATQAGTPGDDVLIGTTGPDVINGLGGRDRIEGRGGDDVLCGGAEADLLVGGNGADRLYGQAGNDGLDGGAGDDLLSGAAGEDVLVGGLDDDTLEGDEADDRLEGGDGFDRLDGGDGDDLLRGGRGLDVLYGGLGRDQLFGQEEGDIVNGGPANDLLSGGSGNDRLGGQAGNDQLFGDDGDDRMDGGTDGDVCTGGPHAAGDTAVNCEVVNGVP